MLLETWSAEHSEKRWELIILDGHETNTSQNSHDDKKVPKTDTAHESKTPDVYMMRSTAINITVFKRGLSRSRYQGGRLANLEVCGILGGDNKAKFRRK